MAKFKVIEGKTLEEYQTKYKKKLKKLVSFTKKEVKDFDEFHKDSITCENYLLEHNKWWLINDTYYQLPKKKGGRWALLTTLLVLGVGAAGGWYHFFNSNGKIKDENSWKYLFNELNNNSINRAHIKIDVVKKESDKVKESFGVEINKKVTKFIKEGELSKYEILETYKLKIATTNVYFDVTEKEPNSTQGYAQYAYNKETKKNTNSLYAFYLEDLITLENKYNEFDYDSSKKSYIAKSTSDIAGSYVTFTSGKFKEIKYHKNKDGLDLENKYNFTYYRDTSDISVPSIINRPTISRQESSDKILVSNNNQIIGDNPVCFLVNLNELNIGDSWSDTNENIKFTIKTDDGKTLDDFNIIIHKINDEGYREDDKKNVYDNADGNNDFCIDTGNIIANKSDYVLTIRPSSVFGVEVRSKSKAPTTIEGVNFKVENTK